MFGGSFLITHRIYSILVQTFWIWIAFISTLHSSAQAQSAKITWIVSVPADTPSESKLFIAGNLDPLGPWQPSALEMIRFADGKYQASLEVPIGTRVEYKITRGSWATVEKSQDGSEIRNRTLIVRKPETIEISVANWAIAKPKPRSTATGDLRWKEFFSQVLNQKRRITVWLPSQYRSEPDNRFPVVYLLDGQNVFDDRRAAFGTEWRADETASQLAQSPYPRPLILVAIDNSKDRMDEYTPVSHSLTAESKQGGRADEYLSFIANELKPWIDREFRTQASADSTAIVGSSLGGLFVLTAIEKRPDTFGKGAAMSPSLFWGKNYVLDEFSKPMRTPYAQPIKQRLWIDIGTLEANDLEGQKKAVEQTKQLDSLLKTNHSERFEVQTMIEPEANHHESAWARRLPKALEFLFPIPTEPKPK